MERRRALFDFDKYEPIEWAKCNGVCRVNTGLICDSATSSLGAEFKLKMQGNTSGMIFFDSKWQYAMQVYTNSGNRIYNHATWGSVTANSVVECEVYNTSTQRKLKINGGNWMTNSVNVAVNNDAEIQLFSRYNDSLPCTECFNYMNITRNGVYARKYRFCKRKSDGLVLLVDTLTDTLYYNVGSGYFSEYTI